MTIFNGMRIKHQIKSLAAGFEATLEDLQKAKNDVILNITAYYLQVLQYKELVRIAASQVELSRLQVNRSQLFVDNGKMLESELLESKASWAQDKLNLTQNNNNLSTALLELSQALNRKSSAGFDVAEPSGDELLKTALHSLRSYDTTLLFSRIDDRPETFKAVGITFVLPKRPGIHRYLYPEVIVTVITIRLLQGIITQHSGNNLKITEVSMWV